MTGDIPVGYRNAAARLEPANRARQAAAAVRNIATARLLLPFTVEGPGRDVLLARIEHPDWSWSKIGASLGMTKDQAVGKFRYMVRLADRTGASV